MKVIFTKGLQCSNKTTWSKKYVKDHTDYKRVNRDDIRHMCVSYIMNKDNEILVSEIEKQCVIAILNEGYNLIIDAMHLNPKYIENWEEFIRTFYENVKFEILEFPIELEVAIERDKKRNFVIGEKVIRETWKKYERELVAMLERSKKQQYNPDLDDAIIFDMDGCLAINNGHRSPYDFSKVIDDECNKIVAEQVHFHMLKNRKIIIVSGRDSCEEMTKAWLDKHGIHYDYFYMRQSGDKRKDSIVKEEIYNTYIKDKFNVVAVFDDRPQVIRMWRSLGLFVFDVGCGIEF